MVPRHLVDGPDTHGLAATRPQDAPRRGRVRSDPPEVPVPRFLSGVQPSGELHLGNYFGAIVQHLALQHQGEALFFIADYHALTTVEENAKARNVKPADF